MNQPNPQRRSIFKHLSTWVLISVVAGILLGHFYPQQGARMEVLSKYFIGTVKLFINPLIFVTITLGISAMGDIKKVGKIGGKAILYFEVVTTIALLIGVVVAHFIQPGRGVIPAGDDSNFGKYVTQAEAFNWWEFFKSNVTIQVLIVSLILGTILSQRANKQIFMNWLGAFAKLLFRALHVVMYAAPIGAFGGMAYSVGTYGIASLIPLAKLMLTVYLTMAVFIFVVLGSFLRYYGISIWKFLVYIRAELLIVLGTSSSEAALPAVMEKLERLGCEKTVVGLVVPSGYSFNLDGTTIYLSMAALFLAQVYGIELTFTQMATIVGVMMVTSKGAAGVTGSGMVVLASTLGAVKIIPMEGLALLIGVDRFMSEARAITNFIGNGIATVVIANHEGAFDREKMALAFDGVVKDDKKVSDTFLAK